MVFEVLMNTWNWSSIAGVRVHGSWQGLSATFQWRGSPTFLRSLPGLYRSRDTLWFSPLLVGFSKLFRGGPAQREYESMAGAFGYLPVAWFTRCAVHEINFVLRGVYIFSRGWAPRGYGGGWGVSSDPSHILPPHLKEVGSTTKNPHPPT